MSLLTKVLAPDALAARVLDLLQSPFAFGVRLYVSWQFWRSGYIKVTSWDSTLALFESEYHTPLLSPFAAAVSGSFGELFFPTLLILGLASRVGALGLSFVNLMAVISYRQVLLAEGYEAALGQHVLWGSLLLFLCCYGPGKISLDHLINIIRSRRNP